MDGMIKNWMVTTMSILNKYIEESEINLDKSIIQKMMSEVYQEACELI